MKSCATQSREFKRPDLNSGKKRVRGNFKDAADLVTDVQEIKVIASSLKDATLAKSITDMSN